MSAETKDIVPIPHKSATVPYAKTAGRFCVHRWAERRLDFPYCTNEAFRSVGKMLGVEILIVNHTGHLRLVMMLWSSLGLSR
jgi:hypothetical protein